jgi:aspartate 1-decarboxylase
MSYAWLDELEADRHKPSVILLDGRNQVVRSSGHA